MLLPFLVFPFPGKFYCVPGGSGRSALDPGSSGSGALHAFTPALSEKKQWAPGVIIKRSYEETGNS